MTIARTLGTSSSKSQPSQLGSRAFQQQKQNSKSQNKAIRRRARTAPAPEPPVPRGHGSGEKHRASPVLPGWHRAVHPPCTQPGRHGGNTAGIRGNAAGTRREGRAEGARPAGNGPDRAAAGGTSDRAAQAPAWRGAVRPSQSVSQSVSVPCPARLADLQPDTPPSTRVAHPEASASEQPALSPWFTDVTHQLPSPLTHPSPVRRVTAVSSPAVITPHKNSCKVLGEGSLLKRCCFPCAVSAGLCGHPRRRGV